MFKILVLCFYDIYLLANKLIMDLVNWIVYFYHKNIQRTSYILPKINKSPRYSLFICPYVKSQDTKMRCMGQATNTCNTWWGWDGMGVYMVVLSVSGFRRSMRETLEQAFLVWNGNTKCPVIYLNTGWPQKGDLLFTSDNKYNILSLEFVMSAFIILVSWKNDLFNII